MSCFRTKMRSISYFLLYRYVEGVSDITTTSNMAYAMVTLKRSGNGGRRGGVGGGNPENYNTISIPVKGTSPAKPQEDEEYTIPIHQPPLNGPTCVNGNADGATEGKDSECEVRE